jgi:hypothetical protein
MRRITSAANVIPHCQNEALVHVRKENLRNLRKCKNSRPCSTGLLYISEECDARTNLRGIQSWIAPEPSARRCSNTKHLALQRMMPNLSGKCSTARRLPGPSHACPKEKKRQHGCCLYHRGLFSNRQAVISTNLGRRYHLSAAPLSHQVLHTSILCKRQIFRIAQCEMLQ